MAVRAVTLGPGVVLGGGGPLVLLAGPCVIESAEHCRRMAAALRGMAAEAGLPFVFKASYDKANRTSAGGFRGPGAAEGLGILAGLRRELGCPVLTDIHAPEEAVRAAEAVDILQIPAFLCRQTDLLAAAGRTGRAVNIKKGQFCAPWDMAGAAGKVAAAGNESICLTERGTTFGYNNLVADMRSIYFMQELGYQVVFDATHSVQRPSAQGGSSGGDRDLAPVLARAAVAAGVDGLFMEVHDNPDAAPCDGPNMIPLAELPALLRTVAALDRVAGETVN